MEFLFFFFVFFFGAMIGSFLGVAVDRLPQGKSIVKGRSHCDYCKKTLSPLDLIPVFSFLFLGGKCRYCQKSLSYFYPVIELITGILFVFVFLNTNIFLQTFNIFNSLNIVYYLFVVSILVTIFFIDLKYGIIPFPIILPAIFITLLYNFFFVNFYNSLFAAVGSSIFFLTLFLITRGRGMGFGDVIYAIFMGLLLGFPKIILGLYIAFISGALISLILIATKRKKLKGSTIPFGPFLVAGTIVSLFWGDYLVSLTFYFFQFTIK